IARCRRHDRRLSCLQHSHLSIILFHRLKPVAIEMSSLRDYIKTETEPHDLLNPWLAYKYPDAISPCVHSDSRASENRTSRRVHEHPSCPTKSVEGSADRDGN